MGRKPMMGNGTKNASVMFILDRPTYYQYKNHSYMCGKEMDVLLEALEELGFDIDEDCYFTALVKEPTPDDRQPIKEEVDRYKDYFQAEISVIDPDIIVPLDDESLKLSYGYKGIIKFRGKAVERSLYGRTRIIFPTINPELVFKQPKYSKHFIKDLENIYNIWEKGFDLTASSTKYRSLETVDDVKTEFKRFRSESRWLVFDIETTGLNPFKPNQRIVCISLTDKDHYGVTVPLDIKNTPWNSNQMVIVKKMLKQLLEDHHIKKIAHNGVFDIKWLKLKYNIDVANLAFDPMIVHYLTVSEESSHGLKELAWEYTDMGGYDNRLDQYKQDNKIEGNYGEIDWNILKEYAAADVDCTYRLYKVFNKNLDKNKKWESLINNTLMPACYTIRDIEINGIRLDHNRVQEYQKAYPERMNNIESKLREYPEVVEIEREKLKLFSLRQKEMKKPKEDRDPKILKFNKYRNFQFKFSSPNQVRELLFNKLGLSTPHLTKKGMERKKKFEKKQRRRQNKKEFVPEINEYSTGKDTLEYLKDKHPIAGLLAEWKRLSKAYSSYVKPALTWEGEDGLVHPEYLLARTVTGRLASQNPNAQNFTKPSDNPYEFEYKYPIKRMFVSRFGNQGIMVQFDYKQQELRVLGIVSGDENMVKVFKSGEDPHKKTASTMFRKPMEDVTSHERRSAKSINFGVIYGKGVASLSEDLGVDEKEAQNFLDQYFHSYPKIKKWLEYTKDFVEQHEYVESITGRRRRLSGIHSTDWGVKSHCQREAFNFPIQSPSADMTITAMTNINNYYKKNHMKSVLCMTVHDSIVTDCYLPEFEKVYTIMKNSMEHLPFKWLGDMPIEAECEIGHNYADMVGLNSLNDLKENDSVLDYIDRKLKEKYQDDLDKANKNIELAKDQKKEG